MIDNQDFPRIDRSTALLYFLAKTGPLTRGQVESMGRVLYEDTKSATSNNLLSVAERAGLVMLGQERRFKARAWGLGRLALSYEIGEFEEVLPKEPLHRGDTPTGLVDWLAGEGSQRPLVLDLYRLYDQLDINIQHSLDNAPEIFKCSIRGKAREEDWDIIFKYTPLFQDPSALIIAGRIGAKLVRQPVPPKIPLLQSLMKSLHLPISG